MLNIFLFCSELTSVIIGSGVYALWSQTFSGCTKLVDVYYMRNKVPVTTESDVFKGSYIEHVTLHVPKGSLDAYKAAEPWKNFKSIVEIGGPLYTLSYIVDGKEYKKFVKEVGDAITPEVAPTKEGYTFSGWGEIPATMPANDVTITGTFTKGAFKLTYMVDGKTYKTFNYDYEANITPEEAPTKEGYTFSGWSEIPSTMPANDVNVTGTFSINKYNLIYKVDGADYKNYEVEYGALITPEAAPTMEGYTFSGWGEIPATMPANDVTITGTFTKGAFKLTYTVDGQTYKTFNYDYEAAITPEPAPTKEGYSFSGWSTIPATMPANDVTVTGTFSINKYNLIYKVDGADYKNYEVEYGSSITPEAAPTKEGFNFSGWGEIPTTMPANDVTITGTFSINKYNLIYKVDGENYKTIPTEYNSTIMPEEAPTKEGYTFSGWSEIPETMPANDVTVTGTFSINKYKLTYYLDGEIYQTSEVKYGSSLIPIADPYVDYSYTFSGWSEVPETMPAHDVDITGTSVPKKFTLEYKVHYSSNLFVYTTYKTLEVSYGATITPEPDATKEGYTFSGWSKIPAKMPGYNVSITGLFTAKDYTLTYQVDGKIYKSYTVKYGAAITPEAAPAIDGFTFNGWGDIPATMPARDVTINGSLTKKATSNVTYPAEWSMTSWSSETISNLESDPKWMKISNSYYYNPNCPKDESIELYANGTLIKETAGIEFAVKNCSTFNLENGSDDHLDIEVFEPEGFFFVLKNLKRGQKVSIDFKSVDYSSDDGYPVSNSAIKMTDRPVTRGSVNSIAEYVVSTDGDVRFNVNADTFFYLYNIDVTDVSDTNLSFLSYPSGINDKMDCYLYWNESTSYTITSWGSSYARGADVRIENKSNKTITITKIEMYNGTTNIGTFTDLNGDLAPDAFKGFSVSLSSKFTMPSTLPWIEIYYTLNNIPYTKKFVSDGTKPAGSSGSDNSGGSSGSGSSSGSGDSGDSGTGIVTHEADDNSHEDIYTLDGRKLGSYPTQKGIYIKNGKKFVVK